MKRVETQSRTEHSEQYSPEEFLTKLYDSIEAELMSGEDAKFLAEFGTETLGRWETIGTWPTGTLTLGADIEKAVLIDDAENTYALVLDRRIRSRYDRGGRTLGVQFGFLPKSDRRKEMFGSESTLNDVSMLVHQHLTHGSGEFYIHELGKIAVDFWADGRMYGGDQIGSWPVANLQSDKGIRASLSVVRETINRAFVY